MHKLKNALNENVDLLMKGILDYALKYDFTKYTSTLEEAWRMSIVGLNESISLAIEQYSGIPELTPDENYTEDPLAKFGIFEAKMHRNRGIPLSMFLSLYKYYKQAYIDFIKDKLSEDGLLDKYLLFVERCFDRIEIAYVTEWSGLEHNTQLLELQGNTRRLNNEKNAYLTVFESYHDPVILINENEEVENMNLSASKLFNISDKPGNLYYSDKHEHSKKIKKRKIFDVVPELLQQVDFQVKFDKNEYKSININRLSRIKYYNILVSSVLDVSKKFSGYIIIFHDITVDIDSNKALKESEHRFRTLVDNIPGTVYRSMLNGHKWETEFISEGIYELSGYKASEILSGKVQFERDTIHKDDLKLFHDNIYEALDIDKPYNLEYRIINKEGQLKWLFERGVGKKLINGSWLVDGVIFDISEQKEREEEINYFFQNSMDMLCIAGFDGYFKKLSPAWNKTLGWKDEELLKNLFMDFIHPEDRKTTLTVLGALFVGTTITEFENKYRCKDGSYKWLAWSANPSVEKKIIYAVARDITIRKRLELDLLAFNDELESRVEERTEELESAYSKLEAALEKEHDLAEQQSQFINMISHEYRTPLSVLSMSTELIQKSIEKREYEKMDRIYSMMNSSIRTLNNLVGDVLDFSRASHENIGLVVSYFSINQLIKNSIEEITVLLNLDQLIIFDDEIDYQILSDEKIVRLIFSELLLNAVKYSDYCKEVVVRINAEVDCLQIQIDDQGVGVQPEDQEKLFEPFFKGKLSIGIREGTGLGLSTAQRYAGLLKGEIKYQGKPKIGSIFTFKLPK
jgi:PAS domain S-box-containing protein